MNAAELLALAERCEAAMGADRELDGAIGTQVQTPGNYRKIPYTASLDAAMGLVPEGWVWTVLVDYELPGRARLFCCTGGAEITDAATPALALCASSLRARAAEGGAS